jgi:predicted transcriptional regulator
MLTLRLDEETTEVLEDFAKRSGMTKSDIAREAIRQYLRAQAGQPNVDDEEVDRELLARARDTRFQRFESDWEDRADQYRDATEVADWVDRKLLFGRRPDVTGLRILTGLNEVVGFTSELGDKREVFVIVRHIPVSRPLGADRHHFYVFHFDEWKRTMRPQGCA